MMIAAVSIATGETALSGSPDDYTRFARILDGSGGVIELDADADVAPYDSALSTVEVRARDTDGVVISVDGDRLLIEGPRKLLSVLADIVRDSAASGDPDGHVHIEYFPGHDYLGEGSVPLVIADAVKE